MGTQARDESATSFERLVAALDYPMFIVTAAAGEKRAGCLVGFATQGSISPPRYIVCISKKNHTHVVALEARALAVHLVPRDQRGLANLFGEETGDELDKFEHCRWDDGHLGVPLLRDCPDHFVGTVIDRTDAGDHTAFLVEVVSAHAGSGSFLPFQQAKEMVPGHEA